MSLSRLGDPVGFVAGLMVASHVVPEICHEVPVRRDPEDPGRQRPWASRSPRPRGIQAAARTRLALILNLKKSIRLSEKYKASKKIAAERIRRTAEYAHPERIRLKAERIWLDLSVSGWI